MLIEGTTDWARLTNALDFYRSKGFTQCELPWHVPHDIIAITCPDPDRAYAFDQDALVGSAEQSFIQAQMLGQLARGRYVALTPCFRREPQVSETHKRYFMKVELYAVGENEPETVIEFANLAHEFMSLETSHRIDLRYTREGLDLEISGMEVGSYAAREARNMTWTCGTGLAEPRFSTACLNASATVVGTYE
jgi:hypothetical protein